MIHEVGFFAAVGLGIPLVLTAHPGKARIAAIVFASCVAGCFGASALYHRPTWQPNVRGWLARLDHAGIYLLIAGTYTPFGLLVLSRDWAIPVLSIGLSLWLRFITATTTLNQPKAKLCRSMIEPSGDFRWPRLQSRLYL